MNTGFIEITLIFQYSCLSHLENSFLLLLWDMSLPREQSIFAWCFMTPFSFAEILLKNAVWSSFFYPFSGHYLAKKICQNFLKCCKSNTTLPFVPYAKIKLIIISVVLKSDTAPSTFCCCFLSSLLLSLSLPHFCLILGIHKASFWWVIFLGKHYYFEGRAGGKWNFLETFLSLFQLCLNYFNNLGTE